MLPYSHVSRLFPLATGFPVFLSMKLLSDFAHSSILRLIKLEGLSLLLLRRSHFFTVESPECVLPRCFLACPFCYSLNLIGKGVSIFIGDRRPMWAVVFSIDSLMKLPEHSLASIPRGWHFNLIFLFFKKSYGILHTILIHNPCPAY